MTRTTLRLMGVGSGLTSTLAFADGLGPEGWMLLSWMIRGVGIAVPAGMALLGFGAWRWLQRRSEVKR